VRTARVLFVALLAAAAAWSADLPRIVYTKSFPGSFPAWAGITVEKSGAVEYKEAPDDDNPLKFPLREPEAAEIFSLAQKLDNFRHPLESSLKVAFMGTKTFRMESGTEKTEVKFNYSEDPSAQALADWFERIIESEQHFVNLERAVKYDKLGVLKALLLLETSMDRKRLVATAQYLPMLDRIVKNETYMHTARVRAAGIADAIRATK
jgi:hypothetical protein